MKAENPTPKGAGWWLVIILFGILFIQVFDAFDEENN